MVSGTEVCEYIGALGIGVVPYGVLPSEVLEGWLAGGYHSDLGYMGEHRRNDPRIVFDDCRSVIVVLFGPQRWSYHSYIRRRLKRLLGVLQLRYPGLRGRGVVDTAPVMERGWGVRAGLGAVGRNSMLLHPRFGSDFNIGILFVDRDCGDLGWLNSDGSGGVVDSDGFGDLCVGCSACVDSCPAGAILDNRTIDCNLCLSHLSQRAARGQQGGEQGQQRGETGGFGEQKQLGCTICQRVCPYNQRRFV